MRAAFTSAALVVLLASGGAGQSVQPPRFPPPADDGTAPLVTDSVEAPSTKIERFLGGWLVGSLVFVGGAAAYDRSGIETSSFTGALIASGLYVGGVSLGVHFATGAREGMRPGPVLTASALGTLPMAAGIATGDWYAAAFGGMVSWVASPLLAAVLHQPR